MPTFTQTPRASARAVLVTLLALAAGLCVWLSGVSPVQMPATVELDPCYQQALARAWNEGMRFGREVIYTNGPFSYFLASPYDADLYGAKLWLWEVLLRGGTTLWWFLRVARRGTALDVAVLGAAMALLPQTGDAWMFVLALFATDLALDDDAARSRQPRVATDFIAQALFALLVLVKVTSMTTAIACVGIVGLQRGASHGWRRALRWLASFAIVLLLTWLSIGQRAVDLPAYVITSLELASGFDAAMSLEAKPIELAFGWISISIVAALALVHARARRSTEPVSRPKFGFDGRRARSLAVLVCAALLYKAGFTRADHVWTFFCVAFALPYFLLDPTIAAPRWRLAALRTAGAALLFVLAVTGSSSGCPPASVLHVAARQRIDEAWTWFRRPGVDRAEWERRRSVLARRFALPRIRSIVDDAEIACFDNGHGLLFLNDLRWRPQPVMQAYTVFTPRSARRNAGFFESNSAPRFVLFDGSRVDGRLPGSEDPLALQALLAHYALRTQERGVLLLERRARNVSTPRTIERRGTVVFGEPLVIPKTSHPLVLRARVAPSWRGRLRGLVYQRAKLEVEVVFGANEPVRQRIAPFALECGIVVRPWLPTRESWIQVAGGHSAQRSRALKFHADPAWAFDGPIEYELERADDLESPAATIAQMRELVLSLAGQLPQSFDFEGEPEPAAWPGMEGVVLAPVPASLVFDAPSGRARLRCRLSVPPWLAGYATFRGIQVRVRAGKDGDYRVLRRELLAPIETGSASPVIDLEVESDLAEPGFVRLEFQPAPECDPATAKVGIRALSFEPLPNRPPP